jgi:hypothetical protein
MIRYEEKNEAGRVVDLRKMAEPENKEEIKPEKKAKAGFFAFRRGQKTHRVDFYKHYKNLEKKEDFVEREILREYLDDEDEEKKQNILISFFNFLTRVLKLWWLPLFIIRFVWILFWRVGKLIFFRKNFNNKRANQGILAAKIKKPSFAKATAGEPSFAKATAGEPSFAKATAGEPSFAKATAGEYGLKILWQSLWAIPGEVKDFLLGRTTEDYLYQRVLAKEISKKKFHPFRHLFFFVFFLFILIMPIAALNYYNVINLGDLRGRVLGVSEKGLFDLQSAAASVSDFNLQQASQNFGAAKESFKEANDKLSQISDALFELGKIIPNDKIKLAAQSKEILAAGEDASSLGNNLTLAVNCFFTKNGETLSQMIDNFVNYEILAIADAKKLNQDVTGINPEAIPENYREQFISLKQKGTDLEELLTKNVDFVKKINLFLGRDSDKRYLLVFENNSEMRASGGFIGSYALADFSRGKITNIEAPGGGSYVTEGGLKINVAAPEPMYLVNPLWHFWDANWWPDWQKSAKKLTWFYEKSGGPTTDGVIAFTPTVLERILQTIGPIDMTDTQGVVMTSDNLWDNLRLIIEKEKVSDSQLPYTLQENKPKKVIGQLMQKIMAELPGRMDRQKFTELLSGLETDLSEKQILFYFKDAEMQAEAESRNWAGRLKETNKDYLMVVNTNIAGGKSDRKMEETINHQAAVQEDGSIIDTVTITRTHTGTVDDQFSGMRNVDWMRIYVPQGSELLGADGFRGPNPIYFSFPEDGWQTDSDVAAEEGNNAIIDQEHLNTKIYTEEGKTVFANWSMVDPGNTAAITLKYKLPFKLELPVEPVVSKTRFDILLDKVIPAEKKNYLVYSLLAQKQAGSLFSSINTELILPENFTIAWEYPEKPSFGLHYWKDSSAFDSDKYWAAVIEKGLGN